MPENLERRGDKWYWRAMIEGKLYRRSTGFRDLKSALRRASDFERDVRAGVTWGEKPVPVFDHWASRCLNILMGGKRDPAREEISAAHAIKLWSGRKLNEIKPTDCEEYIQGRLKAGAARGSIAREIVTLSRMFRMAVADDTLTKNPWAEVRRVKGGARTRVLTLEEETRLRPHLPMEWEKYLTVALLTGLRLSEQIHLRPVDIRDGLILVGSEHAKRGKARAVPVKPEVTSALETIKPKAKTDRYWSWDAHVLRYHMEKAREEAKVAPFRIHDLRRTFGTRCAEAGMLPQHLKDILGHTSVETTMTYYVHLSQLSVADAMSKTIIPIVQLETGL